MSLASPTSSATGVSPAAADPALQQVIDEVDRWFSRIDVRRLANGMTACVLPDRRAPLVASAIAYRAGTRDEGPGLGGAAHFLEHMMFKGSERFGLGEIDRLTQAAGGSNNAFTSHDLTLYYFTFASDRWRLALDIEADRMAGLLLDPAEVESERQVIHEEIAMYEGEPWDMLMQEVQKAFFGDHPYARPVLGTRAELDAHDRNTLGDFHRRFYRPSGAVAVITGDVDPEAAHAEVAERFAALDSAASLERPEAPTPAAPRLASVERRQGELARLELAFPSPAADDPLFPVLRLLLGVLTLGRTSRLHRALVDDSQQCLWVSADAQETLDPGIASVTAELVPGGDPQRVEAAIQRELDALLRQPPSEEEIARVRRVILADWLFAHERTEQRTFLIAGAAALVDLGHPARALRRLLGADRESLLEAARRFLEPERRIVGWSWPEEPSR
ncbi:MAG: pitrilysin family protein [Acidobacteriota bacterium]